MSPTRRFPASLVREFEACKYLGLRAGASHRFIAVWVVVVEDRVFVRSWYAKPDGWFPAFRREPDGTIQLGKREVPVRARLTRSERLRHGVDRAYAVKYPTPASRKWVVGFRRPQSRATTTELLPR